MRHPTTRLGRRIRHGLERPQLPLQNLGPVSHPKASVPLRLPCDDPDVRRDDDVRWRGVRPAGRWAYWRPVTAPSAGTLSLYHRERVRAHVMRSVR
ncbi:hypothetical protein SAMN05192568_104341 [Methylobacterium pseudosasicola]|uniref:Uncharacterized protein n=1 Tax=Methylobacterium pseudosasicola TaxID=582667 RepID=A0A1I4SME7_9HYPH|nr:hypothetical protein SAMN05192568_104341 [Methylobacterium pseudosasicola]